MRAFRAICAAAVLGLVVACAFPQGRGHDSDGGGSKGSGSSGGSSHGSGSSASGGSRGSGSSVSHDRGGSGGTSNSTYQGRGDGDLGRGGRGGGSTGSGGSGSGSGSSGSGRGSGGSSSGHSGGSSSGGTTDSGRGGGWGSRDGGGPSVISGPGSQGRDSGFDLGRKASHSGSAHYNGSNNVVSSAKIGSSVVISHAPSSLRNLNSGGNLINRKDHPVLIRNGFRTGYYFYTPLWCDDYFWYPFYIFEPWNEQCCISPWYYYPMLPPYVAYDRCRFDHYPAWGVWVGYSYPWSRPAYYGNYDYWGRGHGSAIDYAVDDIVNAFEHQDRRAAGRLISNQDDVAIYVDGKYSYTINAKDFYDMFLDATQNTKTKRYEILSVQTGRSDSGADCIRVTARHEYEDPWGQVTMVEHFYELRYDGPNLVISKFGVSGGSDSH